MGRTESSASWTGQNSPQASSRNEQADFELEDLALAYGARLPLALLADSTTFFSDGESRAGHCANSGIGYGLKV